MTNTYGEDGITRLMQAQERIQKVVREEVQGWMDALFRDAFNSDSFLRLVATMGLDLSQIPNMVGKQGGFDPYRVLSLERSASDEEVKKRYRELLIKLHPDTAGVRGTDFLLQMMIVAYQQIAKARGWQ
ncbi:MAG: J domain-containing protein [Candidatus Omnitrophica bacterium]|nr:J domain-containing protein [Candidatus Omnitrophota bacterium]